MICAYFWGVILQTTFSMGDHVVYPGQGVAEVVGFEQREIAGTKLGVLLLRIIATDMKVMVPTKNSHSVGLRHLMDPAEVVQLYELLQQTDIPRDTQTWNRRSREYTDKLKTGSSFEIAEVFRDLSRLKLTKELCFGERKILETARNFLVRELAICKKTTELQVGLELDAMFAPVLPSQTPAVARLRS
jgi:CarD family transcriptional regulator